MAIDINSLFQDILETPEQKREKMLAQGAAQGQLATSNLTGFSAAASPLIQALYQNMPQRNEAMRTAVGGLLGKDLRTTSDKVQEAMSRFNPLDPQSVVGTTNMLREMGLGTQAAQLAAMAAEEQRNKRLLSREEALRDLEMRQVQQEMEASKAEAERSAMWRDSVASQAAGTQYAGWSNAIRNGSMPPAEVNRIAAAIDAKPTMDIVQGYVGGLHMSLHTDGEGNYYDMAMQPVNLGPEDTVFKGSVTGGFGDMSGLNRTTQSKLIEDASLATTFIASAQNVIDFLEQNRDSTTAVGKFSAIANSIEANAKAAINLLKITGTDRPAIELFDVNLYPQQFKELGVENAQQKAYLLGVALQYAAISGQGTARSLSDKDVEKALMRVGAGQQDAATTIQLLKDAQDEADRTFKIKYKITTGNEYDGSLFPEVDVSEFISE